MNKKIALIIALALTARVAVFATTFYVNAANTGPVAPFTNWMTATTDIQNAIDLSNNGDLILVTNGTYAMGGRVVSDDLTNRVIINKNVTVQSMNGPTVTIIQGNSILGSNAVRCVYMISNSVLSGFTVTNGGTSLLDTSGGGIYADGSGLEVVTNCVLIGNAATSLGGGAYNATVYNSSIIRNNAYGGGGLSCSGSIKLATNCWIWGNSALAYGGGAEFYTLKNCLIAQNAASFGGGVDSGSLYGCLVVSNSASSLGGGLYDSTAVVNCTVLGNSAYSDGGGIDGGSSPVQNSIAYYNTTTLGTHPNYLGGSFAFNCCIIPATVNEFNCITNDPGFVSYASGNYHLNSNSPCINGGANSSVTPYITTDLDGSLRTIDGFVDIGAYEYQIMAFILPYYYAQEYGLPLDGTADSDGDGMNNWEECFAGTNPTNAASVIKMGSMTNNVFGKVVTWESVALRIYHLQRSTNLLANPAFVSIYTNSASPSTNLSFTDITAPKKGASFYRVSVQ